jgi:hypothetical protein
MAPGEREVAKAGHRRFVTIRSLPEVPASRVSVRTERKPDRVVLQPQGTPLTSWRYENGRVEATVPGLVVHQMLVLEFDD